MYDSIIFDMDGTLVDFTEATTISWNETFLNHGYDKVVTLDEIKSVMGLNTTQIGKKFFPKMSEQKAKKAIEIACFEECSKILKIGGKTYIPDRFFMDKLSSKYKLFIVSNCEQGYIETFYKLFGYEHYFEDYANAGSGLTKAENIALMVKKHDLENPVYIGDTMLDYESCKLANVDFIHAEYGFGQVEHVKKIKKLEDILTLKE